MLNDVELLQAGSLQEEVDLIERFIGALEPADGVVKILEAGCGQRWSIRLEGINYHLTGVDADAHALELRKTVVGDLDDAIFADLRSIDLGVARFDVIYSAFVLEHIDGVE